MLGESFPTVLDAARQGAGWAFERLYRDLAPQVTGYLRARGAHDADALASEAFLGVFRGLGTFAGDEPAFRAWVFTIAHRRLIDERRRAATRPLTDTLETERIRGGDVEVEALASVGDQWVRDTLQRLSPDQRDVLLLRIVGDLTVEHVAQLLGKTPNAVKQLQRRGLERLRQILSKEGVTL